MTVSAIVCEDEDKLDDDKVGNSFSIYLLASYIWWYGSIQVCKYSFLF